MENENKIACIIDGLYGIHIPQMFARDFKHWNNITDEQREVLKDAENINYWDTWKKVYDNAYWIDKNGFKWSLYQDNDLFAVRSDYNFEDNFS